MRDMIVEAWLDSASTPVGYPMVNVRDIESLGPSLTGGPAVDSGALVAEAQ